jgi:hypothetical protein
MNDQPNDPIDALLQKGFEGPVPDDGFSARVMQVLPARRPRQRWVLPAATAAGIVACWLALTSTSLLRAAGRDWTTGTLSPPILVLLVAMVGMSLLATWWAMTEADAPG